VSKILYINTHAARYGWYFGRRMPRGYSLAAKFWGSGLIDRTKTLYTGFPYQSLYPLPSFSSTTPPSDIGVLCDHMGMRLTHEAINAQRKIQIFWSGGIDSTAAAVGIIKAATQLDCLDRQVEFVLTEESTKEYPEFYTRFIKPLRHKFVTAPVTSHFSPRNLIVTGEHGDQIFGSAKAEAYVADGRAFKSFESVLPEILTETLGASADADTVIQYIEPLLRACPIKLKTIFDAFWWINFSCKWQIVGLRLAVFRVTDVRASFEALRHFFTHPSFQEWSLSNHDKKIQGSWQSYKMPLKDYIFEFTGDDDYRKNKVKVPSLKAVFIGDVMQHPPAYRILMDEDFEPVFWEFQRRSGAVTPLNLPPRNRGL
jgi:hypothetical protein